LFRCIPLKSRAGLDAIVWKTLNNYDPSFFNGEPQATPIEEIIENNFGLKIRYIRLRKFGKVLEKTVFTDFYVDVYCLDEKQYGLNNRIDAPAPYNPHSE
jgi:hypothetical protein